MRDVLFPEIASHQIDWFLKREKECEAQGRDPAPHTLSLLSLLMQRYPTCDQKNARNLHRFRELAQDNDPDDSRRCWQ